MLINYTTDSAQGLLRTIVREDCGQARRPAPPRQLLCLHADQTGQLSAGVEPPTASTVLRGSQTTIGLPVADPSGTAGTEILLREKFKIGEELNFEQNMTGKPEEKRISTQATGSSGKP
jgi:hypothetical protein